MIGLLRGDEMNMAIDTGGSKNQMLTRDSIGAHTDHHTLRNPIHNTGVTALTDTGDFAIADTDVSFNHP